MHKISVLQQLLFVFLTFWVLFSPNKLPNKVRIIGVIGLIVLAFFVFEPAAHAFDQYAKLRSFGQYQPKTELSKKATQLKIGMAKRQVIKLLGKPTWAEHVKGVPLAWIWKNGNCNPVLVTFNRYMQVNGMDEGRSTCQNKPYSMVPNEQFLCSRSDEKNIVRRKNHRIN